MELNTLYNENCLETMKRMPSGYVDMIITSPPYDDMKDYNGYTFDFYATAREMHRILKDGGVIVWIVNDQTKNGSESGTSFKQALFFMNLGLNLHDTMIWHKPNAFNFGSNLCYRQLFEYMFVFSKGRPKSIHLIHDVPNRCAGQVVSGGRKHTDGSRDPYRSVMKEWKRRDNVWDVPVGTENVDFPAVFPLQMVKDHIVTWSDESDIVYDPFMGSGTTALACIQTKRQWIGSEISSEYCEKAEKRIMGACAPI